MATENIVVRELHKLHSTKPNVIGANRRLAGNSQLEIQCSEENVMFDKQPFMNEEIVEDYLCRESTRNLFGQPDVTVIHEYLHVYRSNTAHTPEVRLIAAVLEDAIDCYLKYCSAKTRRGKRIFIEAAQWIFDRNEDWLFGFDNICEMLKLDPDYIRRVLKQSAQERLLNQPAVQQPPPDFTAVALRLAS
jgi:hypothetical protein